MYFNKFLVPNRCVLRHDESGHAKNSHLDAVQQRLTPLHKEINSAATFQLPFAACGG